jgi:hypothetical protein
LLSFGESDIIFGANQEAGVRAPFLDNPPGKGKGFILTYLQGQD